LKFNPFRDSHGADKREENSDEAKDEGETSHFIPEDVSNGSKEKIKMSIHLIFQEKID
jgi:hypothetical protein